MSHMTWCRAQGYGPVALDGLGLSYLEFFKQSSSNFSATRVVLPPHITLNHKALWKEVWKEASLSC